MRTLYENINESFFINEASNKEVKLWNDLFNSLDEKIKNYNSKNTDTYNTVVKLIEKTFKNIPNSISTFIAIEYENYRINDKSIDDSVNSIINKLQKFRK